MKPKKETLFDIPLEDIEFQFPVIIKYKKGNMIERFYENGVREYIVIGATTSGFCKIKISDTKENYESYIKTLIRINEIGSEEDFQFSVERLEKYNEDLSNCSLEQTYEQYKNIEYEQIKQLEQSKNDEVPF